jgi:phage-related protein
MQRKTEPKPVLWVGSSRKDIRLLPEPVQRIFGYALYRAQTGNKHPDAKPLKGFGGAGVLEVVEDDDGRTFRAVYTVKFADAVYVLHVFEKKSKSGIKTAAGDIKKVRARLKEAESHYESWCQKQKRLGEGED